MQSYNIRTATRSGTTALMQGAPAKADGDLPSAQTPQMDNAPAIKQSGGQSGHAGSLLYVDSACDLHCSSICC